MLRGCGKLRGSTSYKVRFSTSSQPDKHLYVPVSVCELPPGQSLSTIPCRRVPGKICHKHVHRTLLRKISVDIQTFSGRELHPLIFPSWTIPWKFLHPKNSPFPPDSSYLRQIPAENSLRHSSQYDLLHLPAEVQSQWAACCIKYVVPCSRLIM